MSNKKKIKTFKNRSPSDRIANHIRLTGGEDLETAYKYICAYARDRIMKNTADTGEKMKRCMQETNQHWLAICRKARIKLSLRTVFEAYDKDLLMIWRKLYG